MPGGGFMFLSLTFQYLVGWEEINFVISIILVLFSTFCGESVAMPKVIVGADPAFSGILNSTTI
jgi:hypothetical protein